MKTLLVTGGAGFIGSNFIKFMLKKHDNYKIINLDNLTYAGNLENLEEIQDDINYKFVKGDIANRELVRDIFSFGINYVINFAAESHVDRSIESPEIFIKTNVIGTQVLLEAAKQYDIEKFIQISTDEVYGTLDETALFTEETPLAPNNPYAASKAGGDMLVRSYFKTYNLPINITRCSNNYGPFQFPEKLIPLMIINALNNKYLPVYGDGLQIRDWLHVKDHCRAIDLVLHKGVIGEVYNIGGNNEKTNIEIVKLILNKLNKPQSLIEHVKDRLGHDRRYGIDSGKIQKELVWKSKYTFKTGIEETIKWYIENEKWWDKIKICVNR